MIGNRNGAVLGLSVTDQQIVLVECSPAQPVRWGAVKLSPELSLERDAAAVGSAVAEELKKQQIRVRRVVVGLPTRWLMTAEREVPPSDVSTGQALLRLQAERLGSVDSHPMTFDCLGDIQPSQPSQVLLVGAPQQRITQVQRMAEAAGLQLVAVTSTVLSLAELARRGGQNINTLALLGGDGAALVGFNQGRIRAVRHLSLGALEHTQADFARNMGTELRKALVLMPGQVGAASNTVVWDAIGLDSDSQQNLAQSLGGHAAWGDISSLLKQACNSNSHTAALQPAVIPALALACCAGSRNPPVNWLDSRLKVIPARRWGRRSVWAAVLVAVGVLALGMLFAEVQSLETQRNELNQQLSLLAEEIKSADAAVQRVSFGAGYFETRPPMLEKLREIALAFGYDAAVWSTSLTLKDSGQVQISGRATDQRAVLALLDRLKKSQRFRDVKLLDTREAGGNTRDVSFSMSLVFVKPE